VYSSNIDGLDKAWSSGLRRRVVFGQFEKSLPNFCSCKFLLASAWEASPGQNFQIGRAVVTSKMPGGGGKSTQTVISCVGFEPASSVFSHEGRLCSN